MSTLVLELKARDLMIINGAPLRICNNTRIELNGPARFLFGKQIMPPNGATTPGRRIYYAVQAAYVGDEHARPLAREQARELCAQFAAHTTSRLAVELLDQVMLAVDQDRCYEALKLLRRIISHDDTVLAGGSGPDRRMAAA